MLWEIPLRTWETVNFYYPAVIHGGLLCDTAHMKLRITLIEFLWISQRAGFLMFWISTAISENDWIWFGTCLNPRKPIWHGSLDWEVFACGGCKSCSASLLPRLSQQDYLLRPGWGHCPVRFFLCFSVSANPRPFSAAASGIDQPTTCWTKR